MGQKFGNFRSIALGALVMAALPAAFAQEELRSKNIRVPGTFRVLDKGIPYPKEFASRAPVEIYGAEPGAEKTLLVGIPYLGGQVVSDNTPGVCLIYFDLPIDKNDPSKSKMKYLGPAKNKNYDRYAYPADMGQLVAPNVTFKIKEAYITPKSDKTRVYSLVLDKVEGSYATSISCKGKSPGETQLRNAFGDVAKLIKEPLSGDEARQYNGPKHGDRSAPPRGLPKGLDPSQIQKIAEPLH